MSIEKPFNPSVPQVEEEEPEISEAQLHEGRQETPEEIARRYSDRIPEEDKTIVSKKQLESSVFALLKESMKKADEVGTGGDLLATGDKLGNAPWAIRELAFPAEGEGLDSPEKRREAADMFDSFGVIAGVYPAEGGDVQLLRPEQLAIYGDTDKVANFMEAGAPSSVEQAVLKIILAEGENSTVDVYAAVAEQLRESDMDLRTIFDGHIAQMKNVWRDADNMRRQVLLEFLRQIYPELIESDEVQSMILLWSEEDRAELIEEFGREVDRASLPDFWNHCRERFSIAENEFEELDGMSKKFATKGFDASGSLGAVEIVLKNRLNKRLGFEEAHES